MPDPRQMSEATLQNLVLGYVRARGLLAYHTHDSRRSEPGWPDLVIVGDGGVLYRELKSKTGRVSPDQLMWIDALEKAGANADVWRPVDWPHRICSEIDLLRRCTAQRPIPSQAAIRRHLQRRGAPNLDGAK